MSPAIARAEVINPLIATLKPQSNGLSYNNTVIGTLAVDGWAVTFSYSEEGLLVVPDVTVHPSTASVPTSYYSMWQYKCNNPPINALESRGISFLSQSGPR